MSRTLEAASLSRCTGGSNSVLLRALGKELGQGGDCGDQTILDFGCQVVHYDLN